jgi:hypothetical protein
VFGKIKAMGIYHLERLGEGYWRPEKRNLGNKNRGVLVSSAVSGYSISWDLAILLAGLIGQS